ncbi:MAG: accessory factor UbiK family protein [Rickettsia endosymbiont of Oxypoda opaca]|nr:accessory factor UbiK family protein [Rickettsia endosymbiont of Oxypoda opaca]
MKTNNILKVMIGAGSIAQKVTNNIVEKSHNLIEDKILKGNYVTREEFDKLQILVIKLQKELAELRKD